MGHLGLFESILQRIIIFCVRQDLWFWEWLSALMSGLAILSLTVRNYWNCLINFDLKMTLVFYWIFTSSNTNQLFYILHFCMFLRMAVLQLKKLNVKSCLYKAHWSSILLESSGQVCWFLRIPKTFNRIILHTINTLHNTKRLGPFLVFGYNSGEKQNRDILILSRR